MTSRFKNLHLELEKRNLPLFVTTCTIYLDQNANIDIEEKIESKELELTENQRERAKWEFQHAVTNIEA